MSELKAINGSSKDKPLCVVTMDGSKIKLDDFVVVGMDGDLTHLLQNADAVTLGYAADLIKQAYKEELNKLNEEDKKEVMQVVEEGVE